MNILNDILAESNGTRTANKIEKFIANLPEEEATKILEILKGDEIGTSAILRAFRKNGFTVSHATLSRFREAVRGDI